MHIFTSITANYIPKARVLAASVKRHQPDAQFHLVLSDRVPAGWNIADEPFDSLIQVEELPVDAMDSWIFRHSVVELCTAVKGLAIQEIMRRFDADKVIYFDPDMAVFSPLTRLEAYFEHHEILLTPHMTAPEDSRKAIMDNEISCLLHGVYNLGFVGVRNRGEGRRFVDWWAARLQEFCYDSKEEGLFTDQRWVDLAPAFFENLAIMKDPQFNVATWNLSHRKASGSLEQGIEINGQPLCFYHFSGFDSGAQEIMLKRYGADSPVLTDLRNWYIDQCAANGQEALGREPSTYDFYSNGERITRTERIFYRKRKDLQAAFPHPRQVTGSDDSYYHWYRTNVDADPGSPAASDAEKELRVLRSELDLIRGSGSFRLARRISAMVRRLRGY